MEPEDSPGTETTGPVHPALSRYCEHCGRDALCFAYHAPYSSGGRRYCSTCGYDRTRPPCPECVPATHAGWVREHDRHVTMTGIAAFLALLWILYSLDFAPVRVVLCAFGCVVPVCEPTLCAPHVLDEIFSTLVHGVNGLVLRLVAVVTRVG